MKQVFVIGIAWVALLLAMASGQAQQNSPTQLTVVELFTSQGCNSCPPADALLGELAKRDDLIALSFNVDYWDYLGWQDTLADPAYTQRQRNYAQARNDRRVYTPQMVVGGMTHMVGSDRRAVLSAIDKIRGDKRATLNIEMTRDNKRILVRLPDGKTPVDATIWLVRFDRTKEVAIRRGENGGRTIVYHNVVRDLRNIGLWRGEAMEIAFMQEDLAKGGRDGCAIIIQLGGHGAIIGAASMDFS